MNDKSNDLVTLQWLLTPLNEQMNAVHNAWQTVGATVDFNQMADEFHQLGNVLSVANLTSFAQLAYLLKQMCLHVANEPTLAPKLFYASKLLQYEINRYIMTGINQQILINLRTHYLQNLLSQDKETLANAITSERFSSQFQIPSTYVRLSDDAYQKLALAWRHGSSQLLNRNENVDGVLNTLAKAANYLHQATHNDSLRSLWYMARLWLLGLALNEEPLPHQYAYLLAQLDEVITTQGQHNEEALTIIWVENLLVDIYIQLSNLSVGNEETHEVLSALNYSMSSEALFFPYILGVIEGMLFAMARGEIAVHVLEEIKEQLTHRGWSFYEAYVAQIIDDINSSQGDPELFAQMQWQITTQLQDLYTAIQNTHESIQSKVGEAAAVLPSEHSDDTQVLRRVRILVEEIKYAFSGYLQHKDARQLPDQTAFDEMGQIFADMGMYDVGEMSAKLGELFAQLKKDAPAKLGWSFAYATADGLSLLELFLDGLAKQIFDQALLSKAKKQLSDAYQLIHVVDQEVDTKPHYDTSQVRYDDSGEVIPSTANSNMVEEVVEVEDGQTVVSQTIVGDESVALNEGLLGEGLRDAQADTPNNAIDNAKEEMVDDDYVVTDDTAAHLADVVIDASSQAQVVNQEDSLDDDLSDEVATSTTTLSQAYQVAKDSLKPDSFDFDEDIREIFIEESEEVLEAMDELLPTWQNNPSNLNALKDIRRGFHTLKGSGRMVGAYSVGEMAWAVENMLNRVLDGTLPATAEVANFVAETRGLVPTLVQDFADKNQPSLDPAIVVLKANNLLVGRDINADLPATDKTDLSATKEQSHNTQSTDDAIVFADDKVIDNEVSGDEIINDASIGGDEIIEEVIADEGIDIIMEDVSVDEMIAIDGDEIIMDDEDGVIIMDDDAFFDDDIDNDVTDVADEQDSSEKVSIQEVPFDDAANLADIDEALVVDIDNDIKTEYVFDENLDVQAAVPSDNEIVFDDVVDVAADMISIEATDDSHQKNHQIDDSSASEDELVVSKADNVDDEAILDDEATDVLMGVDSHVEDLDSHAENSVFDDVIFDDEATGDDEDEKIVESVDKPIFADEEGDEGVINTPSINTSHTAAESDAGEAVSDIKKAVDDSDETAVNHEVVAASSHEPVAIESQLSIPEVLVPFIADAKNMPAASVDDVDEDIKEIYIEEAGEVLETIAPLFGKYKQTLDDRATLTDIRRGFHTLKGSGRMVGAVELGELAWSIENMLNRVLDGTVAINDGMVALIDEVLAHFADWVGLFENNSNNYPDLMTLQIAAAHAYSKGHGDKFDYGALVSVSHTDDLKPSNDLGDDDVLISQAQEQDVQELNPQATVADIEMLHSMQEAGQLISNAAFKAPDNDEEDMLCRIFIEEAMELLTTVNRFVAEHADAKEVAVSDEVVRVFHTLRGASGLQPLLAVGEMGAKIEKNLQELQHHDRPMTKTQLQGLGTLVDLIEKHLKDYESNLIDDSYATKDRNLVDNLLADEHHTGSDMDVAGLITNIDTLLDAELELEAIASEPPNDVQAYAQKILQDITTLEERTTSSSKFQRLLLSLNNGYHLLYRHPEQASDDSFIDALLSVHGELTGLFDSLAGSMSLHLNDALIRQLDAKVADGQVYYQTLAEKDSADQLSVDNASTTDDAQSGHQTDDMQVVPAAIEYQVVATDPELLEIFLEEASELDDAIGESFGEWKNNTDNLEALKALQRHLHTVKGGARLAGIGSMGDLTHEAETVYERMVDGRLNPSSDWVRIMQGVQDILSLQIDEIKQNGRTFAVQGVIEQLRSYLDAGEVPEGAVVVVPALDEQQAQPQAVESAPDEQVLEPVISDFERRQLRSWHGVLPDQDILAVFLEEAEDLVESSSEDFQVFRSNTGDIATLQSLQRKLHTIKGGARMVSANGLADLAHQMETVYEDLGSRRRPATRMVIQLLLSCHDWMTAAMTLLKAKLNPPAPTSLIDALESFSRRPDSLTEVPVVSLAEELDAIAAHEAYERQRLGGRDISRMPPSAGLFEQSEEMVSSNEMIRISANLMERMINLSGEAAINRARVDMSMTSLTTSIEEMGVTVQRLADQLRRMDIELEAQILAQIDDKALFDHGDFDPLEMDQYSSLNQLSKSLSESASDLLDLKATLLEKTRDGENLLLQLSRTQNELQDGLMYSRMVPFSRLTPRLQRIVRQVSSELGKSVELTVINADDEMDRTILERITSPLEHMLRNAIDHGIEMPDERLAMGKAKTGKIVLEVVREGSEILVHLTDDGAGINVDAVRKKAISQGLINANDTSLSDLDIMQYIFNAGLSTTNVVTQISGRGVGMDVVRSEIRQLGGSVSVDSKRGQGSRFTMRVPLTVAVSDTLVVRAADRQYAIPLVQIERVTQVAAKTLMAYYQSDDSTLEIDGEAYRLRYLNEILSGHDFSELMSTNQSFPVILVKNQAGQNLALQVDEIVGSRIEVVVKPLGRQLSHVSGISAATIMGDGSVMFILDLMALLRNARARVAVAINKGEEQNKRPVILVVDDSVTVRKVTSRFLERQGFEAVVAKDGVDAIEILQDLMPDLMLLDIEMPRMDGFEVATQVRRNSRLAHLPIIMITSRTGEKHRERAFEIGVTDYMGKPFQENELFNRIQLHLTKQ